MSNITPFSWTSLKQLRTEDVVLRKKLLNLYHLVGGHEDLVKKVIADPLSLLAKDNAHVELVHLVSGSLGQVTKGVAADLLMGLVTLEPFGKKAVVTFEPSLAKLLVQRVLAGESFDASQFFKLELKPLTVLEEAVAQFALISFVDHFVTEAKPQNFKIAFDSIHSGTSKFPTFFGAQESLAVFSLRVKLFDHDFFVKVYLSLDVVSDVVATKNDRSTVLDGVRRLGTLTTSAQIEIAQVTLMPSDLEKLEKGDIILFDSTRVDYKEGAVSGRAEVVFAESQERRGYVVDLESHPQNIRAKLVDVL